jgi:hypothetical protein
MSVQPPSRTESERVYSSPRRRLERVVWIDSGLSFASTWLDEDVIVDRSKGWDGKVVTVGQNIYEDATRLVLGLSYDKDAEAWAGAFLIYKPAIVERTTDLYDETQVEVG